MLSHIFFRNWCTCSSIVYNNNNNVLTRFPKEMFQNKLVLTSAVFFLFFHFLCTWLASVLWVVNFMVVQVVDVLTVKFCQPKKKVLSPWRTLENTATWSIIPPLGWMLVHRTLFPPTASIFPGCTHFVEGETAVVKASCFCFHWTLMLKSSGQCNCK